VIDRIREPESVATSNAQAFGQIAERDGAWLSDDVKSITRTTPRPLHTFIADHAQALGRWSGHRHRAGSSRAARSRIHHRRHAGVSADETAVADVIS
jgi:hypothetical protein